MSMLQESIYSYFCYNDQLLCKKVILEPQSSFLAFCALSDRSSSFRTKQKEWSAFQGYGKEEKLESNSRYCLFVSYQLKRLDSCDDEESCEYVKINTSNKRVKVPKPMVPNLCAAETFLKNISILLRNLFFREHHFLGTKIKICTLV